MAIPQTTLSVPGVSGPVALDMTTIYRVEQRIAEIAMVNRHKAPELLSTFNRIYLEVGKAMLLAKHELIKAERAAKKIRARLVLDDAPQFFASRKLKGTKEQVEAYLDSNEAYLDSLDRIDQIEAIVELLKEKKMAFAMAYSSVKKIFEERAFDYSGTGLNHGGDEEEEPQVDVNGNTVLGDGMSVPVTPVPEAKLSTRAQFGRAREFV